MRKRSARCNDNRDEFAYSYRRCAPFSFIVQIFVRYSHEANFSRARTSAFSVHHLRSTKKRLIKDRKRRETVSSLSLFFPPPPPPPLSSPPVSYMPHEGQYEPDEILARSQRGNEATIFDPQRDKESVGAAVENA